MSDSNYYSFLPFLRQGLASKITTIDNLGPDALETKIRPTINVDVNLQNASNFQKAVHMIGPGDVERIKSDMIMRHAPLHGEEDFLPNYLAFIDFYEEDFPWRYTPLLPNEQDGADQHKLRPWLFLIVLKESEFEEVSSYKSPNRIIEFTSGTNYTDVFPNESQIWAWAHVQSVGSSLGDSKFENVKNTFQQRLNDEPYKTVSRIICPRKLEAEETYHAFLIPAFELGRRAGLGETIGTDSNIQHPAWEVADTNPIAKKFPFYYTWSFKTGTQGDFESLVRRINPGQPHPDLGKIPLNITNPNHPDLVGLATESYIGMGGALKQPGAYEDFIGQQSNYANALQGILNIGDDLNQSAPHGLVDPIVSAPIYGRWHAAKDTVSQDKKWLSELNLDPKYRATAGVGTKIIKDNQDAYMEMAWKQVEEVNKANRELAFSQMGYITAYITFNKNLASLPGQEVIQATASTHAVLKDTVNNNSVKVSLKQSRVPAEMTDVAFTTLTSSNSPLMRRAKLSTGEEWTLMDNVANGSIKTAPESVFPAQRADITEALTPGEMNNNFTLVSQRSDFILLKPGSPSTGSWSAGGTDSGQAEYFRNSADALFSSMGNITEAYPTEDSPIDLVVDDLKGEIIDAVLPSDTYSAQVESWYRFKDEVQSIDIKSFDYVMAAPKIDLPMYEVLRKHSPDFIIPNFHLVKKNSTTLLEINTKFIESFMVGLNHEMSRELLWNEYPTDQRGSYFRRFWKSDVLIPPVLETPPPTSQVAELLINRDILPIHDWTPNSNLGTHNTGLQSADSKLVMVLRADILKKFPNLFVFATPAEWYEEDSIWKRKPKLGEDDAHLHLYPTLDAKMPPDTVLLGFDLTAAEAHGSTDPDDEDPGWFFVIEERVGDIRFGLDVEADPFDYNIGSWNDLTWQHMGPDNGTPNDPDNLTNINLADLNLSSASKSTLDPKWGLSASNMARILYQPGVRLSIHADDMINS